MHAQVLDRLLESLNELEDSIHAAQRALMERPDVEQELIERLQSYESMLVTQRELALELSALIEGGSWEDVARSARIINGISLMLRDDAREVVASLSGRKEKPADGLEFFC